MDFITFFLVSLYVGNPKEVYYGYIEYRKIMVLIIQETFLETIRLVRL